MKTDAQLRTISLLVSAGFSVDDSMPLPDNRATFEGEEETELSHPYGNTLLTVRGNGAVQFAERVDKFLKLYPEYQADENEDDGQMSEEEEAEFKYQFAEWQAAKEHREMIEDAVATGVLIPFGPDDTLIKG